MFAVVTGLRTPAAIDAMAVLQHELALEGIAADCIEVSDLAELAWAALSRTQAHLIVRVRYMDDGLRRLLRETSPFRVYLASDPIDYCCAGTMSDAARLDLVRDAMRQLAVAADLQGDAVAVPIDTEDGPALLREIIRQKLNGVDTMVNSLSGRSVGNEPASSQQPDEIRFAIAGALLPYRQMAVGQTPTRFVISRRMFINTVEGLSHEGNLDVTGRAQHLVNGPWIYIPQGRWRARLIIGFSAELVGAPFLADIAADHGRNIRLRQQLVANSPGVHEFQLSFMHDDALHPLELRLFSEKAIFDGKLSIGYAVFERDLDKAEVGYAQAHAGMGEEIKGL